MSVIFYRKAYGEASVGKIHSALSDNHIQSWEKPGKALFWLLTDEHAQVYTIATFVSGNRLNE